MQFMRLLLVWTFACGAIAQAPPVVVERFGEDSQLGPQVGLKVEDRGTGRRVLMFNGGLWGVDEHNVVRFQLLTDGTLQLFNAQQQATVVLDGSNGQILLRDSAGRLRVAITSWDGKITTQD